MKDKQVGEIWQFYTTGIIPDSWNSDCLGRDWTEDLIVKLIEERAMAFMLQYTSEAAGKERACAEFSIPYAEYLKAKEASNETP